MMLYTQQLVQCKRIIPTNSSPIYFPTSWYNDCHSAPPTGNLLQNHSLIFDTATDDPRISDPVKDPRKKIQQMMNKKYSKDFVYY